MKFQKTISLNFTLNKKFNPSLEIVYFILDILKDIFGFHLVYLDIHIPFQLSRRFFSPQINRNVYLQSSNAQEVCKNRRCPKVFFYCWLNIFFVQKSSLFVYFLEQDKEKNKRMAHLHSLVIGSIPGITIRALLSKYKFG